MNNPNTSITFQPGTTKTGNLDYKIAACLCFVPVFGINLISSLLWIFTEPKESRFVRFYAFQSLLFVVYGVAIGAVGLIGTILAIVTGSGLLALPFTALAGLMSLGLLVLLVLCLWKAFNGQIFKVPITGNIAEKLAMKD